MWEMCRYSRGVRFTGVRAIAGRLGLSGNQTSTHQFPGNQSFAPKSSTNLSSSSQFSNTTEDATRRTENDVRPLTIVLVCDTIGHEGNGTSNSALQFAEELERLGHHVRFVGIGSREYPAQPEWIPLVTRVASWQQMQFARPDEALFRRAFSGADIIHCYLPFSFGRTAVLTARSMGIPATAGFHLQPENVLYSAGPLRYIPFADRIIYRLERTELYSLVRHVHAPSQMIAEQLRHHGYTNKLHVFSNGYDPHFSPAPTPDAQHAAQNAWQQAEKENGFTFADPRIRPGNTGKPIRIVASGRLSNEKDHITLLRAVGLSRYRNSIDLRICGTGPIGERLRYMADRLGIHARIGFVPHDRLVTVLRGADLFIHPSIVDIESISALEAIACGIVPIIARSPLSAAGQFALDDRSLFPARDARALAARIDWWIEHPRQRQEMGPLYARYAREEFSLTASVKCFLEMEREAIADNRALLAQD